MLFRAVWKAADRRIARNNVQRDPSCGEEPALPGLPAPIRHSEIA